MRRMWSQTFPPHALPLPSEAPTRWQGLQLLPGLTAVVGDEGSGKTHLLRALASARPDALWLDLRLPEHDQHTPRQFWRELQAQQAHWQADGHHDLTEALQLNDHLDKALYMLSTGSRRKVALVGLLASGAALTCLDQAFAALDLASARVLRDFLQDMAEHPTRAFWVADYEADAHLPWRSVVRVVRAESSPAP